jgi:hypothetical protein
MDRQEYLTGIGELYAAEVLGEGLANRWIQLTTDPIQKYKLGLFLQLESEAKVRLRPLLARHGISLVEEEHSLFWRCKSAQRSRPWPRYTFSGCKRHPAFLVLAGARSQNSSLECTKSSRSTPELPQNPNPFNLGRVYGRVST